MRLFRYIVPTVLLIIALWTGPLVTAQLLSIAAFFIGYNVAKDGLFSADVRRR